MQRLATVALVLMTSSASALASAVSLAMLEPSRPMRMAALSAALGDLAGAVLTTHPIAALTLVVLLLAGVGVILTTLRPRPQRSVHLARFGLPVGAAKLGLQDLARS